MSNITQKCGWEVEDVLFLHWGGNPEKEICKSWDLLTEILRLCNRSCHQVSLWGYNLKLSKCNQSCFISNDIFKKKVLTIFVNIYLSLTLLNLWHLNTNPTLPLEFKLRKKLEMFRSYIDFCGIHFCGGKVSPGLILWSPDSLNYKLGTTPTPSTDSF